MVDTYQISFQITFFSSWLTAGQKTGYSVLTENVDFKRIGCNLKEKKNYIFCEVEHNHLPGV